MKTRVRTIALALTLLSVPLVVALSEAVSFHLRNRNNGSIVSSGELREYLLHVPSSYDATRPAPLVITLHGGALWPAAQRDISGWNRLADRHGFIAVYPSGTQGAWHVTRPGPPLVKDVRFISDLIDELERDYNIDPTRVYANGLSNGGGMTFVLSCELSERIAAFGMVAAAQMLPWSWCTDARPAPMVWFHGTDDTLVPHEGGLTWVFPEPFPDVTAWTANWARRNRCEPEPVDSSVADDVTRRLYTNCANDAEVMLFTILGGGHTWPGGMELPEWFLGATSEGVDATSEMWDFFQEHRLSSGVVR